MLDCRHCGEYLRGDATRFGARCPRCREPLYERPDALRRQREAQESQGGVCAVHPGNIAVAYALLGRRDEAVAMLDRVAREGMPCYPLFAQDPFLMGLRGYPAFDEFLGRMKTQHDHFSGTL